MLETPNIFKVQVHLRIKFHRDINERNFYRETSVIKMLSTNIFTILNQILLHV